MFSKLCSNWITNKVTIVTDLTPVVYDILVYEYKKLPNKILKTCSPVECTILPLALHLLRRGEIHWLTIAFFLSSDQNELQQYASIIKSIKKLPYFIGDYVILCHGPPSESLRMKIRDALFS